VKQIDVLMVRKKNIGNSKFFFSDIFGYFCPERLGLIIELILYEIEMILIETN